MVKIIYHNNCNDGFAAAVVAKIWLQETHPEKSIHFIPAHYGDEPPEVKGDHVYILDFSYPREILLNMQRQAEFLQVIDHHKTAEAALKDLDFCIFNQDHCGAVLAWQYFFPDREVPEFLRYIEDRDLWQWQMPNSREFHAGLNSYPRTFELWEEWLRAPEHWRLINQGEVVLRYEQKLIDAVMKRRPHKMNLAGYEIPVINTNHLIPEKLNALAAGQPFAAAYFDIGRARIFSLRSDENGQDVSQIAKYYGGGGHHHAAGFKTTLDFEPKIIFEDNFAHERG